jgi:hypothetical protein
MFVTSTVVYNEVMVFEVTILYYLICIEKCIFLPNVMCPLNVNTGMAADK